jgi:hypothetical protein
VIYNLNTSILKNTKLRRIKKVFFSIIFKIGHSKPYRMQQDIQNIYVPSLYKLKKKKKL